MTTYLIDGQSLTDIGDAIRRKTGGSSLIPVPNMPTEIDNIPSGGSPVLDQLSVTVNGTYTPPSGVDGYDEVVVNVPLPDEVLQRHFDFPYNKTNNFNYYADKIVGEQSIQSCRNGALDDNGYFYFSNTNGYMHIPYYFSYHKCYKIVIDIIGKGEYVSGDGEQMMKLKADNNHIIFRWNTSQSQWQMADWTGHVTYLDKTFDYFDGKQIMILYGCTYSNGTYTRNNDIMTLYEYVNDDWSYLYSWEEVSGQTYNSQCLLCLGGGTAIKNYLIKDIKIYDLNNIQ